MDARETGNACKILAGKSAMWLPLGRAMRTWKDSTEIGLK